MKSFQVLFAEEDDADHGDEEEDGDDFEWEQIVGEEEFAQTSSRAVIEEAGCTSAQRTLMKTFEKNGEDGADGDQAANDAETFDLAAFFGFQIEQHNDEEEQDHDSAGIDQDLYGGEEIGVQQDEE